MNISTHKSHRMWNHPCQRRQSIDLAKTPYNLEHSFAWGLVIKEDKAQDAFAFGKIASIRWFARNISKELHLKHFGKLWNTMLQLWYGSPQVQHSMYERWTKWLSFRSDPHDPEVIHTYINSYWFPAISANWMPGRSVGVSATEKVFSPIGKQDFARQQKAAKKVPVRNQKENKQRKCGG